MSIEITKIDMRKVLPYYAPFLLLTAGYILLRKTPFATNDLVLNVSALLQGAVVAWTLFNDSGGTAAYIFSRPMSRKRLFLNRWCFGISVQFLTTLVVFVTVVTGLRSWIQVLMNSPYQPMVKWYELSVVWSIALFSILGYQIVMFLKLRETVEKKRPSTWRNVLGTVAVIGLCLPVLPKIFANIEPIHYQFTYAALVMVLSTLGSLHCYLRQEVAD